jgi:glycosyltransferase involved in cell wall biosynthesis
MISFILPVRNGQAMVAQTVNNLLNQEDVEKEVIVIDDNSTDHTARILKTFDKITLITNTEHKGGAWCRNEGNKIAKGDIIAVCDCDLYYSDRGVAIETFFKENPDKALFHSSAHLRDSKDPRKVWIHECYDWDFNSKCPVSHPTMAYRKEVADKVSYKNETLETDLYEFFLLDAHKLGYKLGGCQDPLMMKVEGDTHRDRSKANEVKKKYYKEYGIEVDFNGLP